MLVPAWAETGNHTHPSVSTPGGALLRNVQFSASVCKEACSEDLPPLLPLACRVRRPGCLAGARRPGRRHPPPPDIIGPKGNPPIVIPVFSWHAASDAVTYELEVGPQSNLNTVYWSAETTNLTLTPTNAAEFTSEPLYWRVRGVDADGHVGGPASRWFVKEVPQRTLVGPTNGHNNIHVPAFEWQAGEGRPTTRAS
jgi:hypothetical protein